MQRPEKSTNKLLGLIGDGGGWVDELNNTQQPTVHWGAGLIGPWIPDTAFAGYGTIMGPHISRS